MFTPDRSGFDALVGNPPWDVMKPNSQEFFSDFDPLYRTYDKQAAIRKQRELCESVTLAWLITGTNTTPGSRLWATGQGT